MSELRAPDPTLDAIERDALIGLDYSEGEPLIGHLVNWANREHVPECTDPSSDAYGSIETIGARHARWFAVPCRVCWPEAPLRGRMPGPFCGAPTAVCSRPWCEDPNHFPYPGLAWQTQVSNRGGESTAPRDDLTGPATRGETRPEMSPGDRGGRVETPECVSGRTATPTTPLGLAVIRANLRGHLTSTPHGLRCEVCRLVNDHGPGCAVAYALALADEVELLAPVVEAARTFDGSAAALAALRDASAAPTRGVRQ